ncbi:MAG: protein kinase [Polyangiaceae bacterium]
MVAGLMTSLAPNVTLADRYQIERLLGRGGMGEVWRAKHLILDEAVAVKVLNDRGDPGESSSSVGGAARDADRLQRAAERLVREIRAAARLRGEHVVRVLDAGRLDDGRPFAVLELLDGRTLADELDEHGKYPLGEAVDLVLQVCEALAEAHALGIVHRDIKPSNLLLTRSVDGATVVKVADFGLALLPEPLDRLTATGHAVGSPPYMSPEQIRATHDIDGASDLWSLGVVLYELCTGTLPWRAYTSTGVLAEILTEAPVPLSERLPDAPDALLHAVQRLLERDRSSRISDALSLARAVVSLRDDGPARVARIERIVDETRARLAQSSRPPPQPSIPPSSVSTVASSATTVAPIHSIEAPTVNRVDRVNRVDQANQLNQVDLATSSTGDVSVMPPVPTSSPLLRPSARPSDEPRSRRLLWVGVVALVALIAVAARGYFLGQRPDNATSSTAPGSSHPAASEPSSIVSQEENSASPTIGSIPSQVASAGSPSPSATTPSVLAPASTSESKPPAAASASAVSSSSTAASSAPSASSAAAPTTSSDDDVSGTYSSRYGACTLVQSGNQVQGSCPAKGIKLSCTKTGSSLFCTWTEAGQTGQAQFHRRNNTLVGSRGSTSNAYSSGPWVLTR